MNGKDWKIPAIPRPNSSLFKQCSPPDAYPPVVQGICRVSTSDFSLWCHCDQNTNNILCFVSQVYCSIESERDGIRERIWVILPVRRRRVLIVTIFKKKSQLWLTLCVRGRCLKHTRKEDLASSFQEVAINHWPRPNFYDWHYPSCCCELLTNPAHLKKGRNEGHTVDYMPLSVLVFVRLFT